MEKAVEVIGDDGAISNPRKRAADLGLRMDDKGQFNSFGDYMHAKVTKLLVQCNDSRGKESQLFSGLSFYVNGQTNPSAHEIKEIVTANGGEYHHYYLHGRTTYQIAENLANTKIEKLRKNEYILKPNFITDCVKENRILPIEEYLLIKKNDFSKVTGSGQLVQEFFHRSRFHLISTMASEFKKFVYDMKLNEKNHEFISRKKLQHLKNIKYDGPPIICHIDMDCFFVSVGLKTRPDLIGKPVAITHSTGNSGGYGNSRNSGGYRNYGNSGNSGGYGNYGGYGNCGNSGGYGNSGNSGGYGEISSCSYEARKKGIHARQYVRDALKYCPDLVCLPYQFDDYVSTAKQLYSIIARYTLKIKAVSCDELYFDIGSICNELDISDPMGIISVIRNEIFEETKCKASAGLGPNWLLARLATKKAKPNGQFYITKENAIEIIKDLPISDLPTVGWNSCENIQDKFGPDVKKCSQLMNYSLEDLRTVLGVTNGEKVFKALRGKCEDLDFNEVVDRKSVSVNVNFGVRLKNEKDLSDLLFGISHELSDRLRQIDKTGIHLTLKYLIRLPDAPVEPAKYGAHGPVYPVRKAGNLSKSTSDENLIHGFSLKLSKQLNPVITDIRGVSLHINKLSFVNGRPNVKKNNGKSLWDYMSASVKTKKKNLKMKDTVEMDESWIEDDNFKKNECGDEMDMKISEVTTTVSHREIQTRLLGNLPEKPKIKEISSNNLVAMMIDNKRINIAGITVNYRKAPSEDVYRQLMYHFKRCVNSFKLKDLKRMFRIFERYMNSETADKNWKPLVMKSKKYLNWYCFNRYERKLFNLEDFTEEEKKEFKSYFSDDEKRKNKKEKSPELFEEIKEMRKNKMNSDGSDEDCLIVEYSKKSKFENTKKSNLKFKKIKNLVKKQKLNHTVVDIEDSNSDDCIILDSGPIFVE